MGNEVSIDYEARCKELEKQLKYQYEKTTWEWQNKLQDERTRTTEIIQKLKTENKFYKDIIKKILHIS